MLGSAIATRPIRIGAPIRWRMVIGRTLLGISLLFAVLVWTYHGDFAAFGMDAWAFYDVAVDDPYVPDAHMYLWSPAFAQLTEALRQLPFDAFLAIFRGLDLVALLAMAPLGAWLALFIPPVASEVNSGNINLVLAACVVFGLRWPVLWTLPLLTKPTLGVGLLWFVVRGDRRALLLASGPAIVLSAVSFLMTPHLWLDWLAFLPTVSADAGWPFPIPIWFRLPLAICLVLWGARTDRPWAAVAGSILAMPRLYFMTPAMLLALLPATGPSIRDAIGVSRRLARSATTGWVARLSDSAGSTVPMAASLRPGTRRARS